MSSLQSTWIASALLSLTVSAAHAQASFSAPPPPAAFSTSLPSDASASLPAAPQAVELKPEKPRHSDEVLGIDYPTLEQRRQSYLYDLIGPRAFLGAGVSALVDQAASLKVGYPPDGYPGPGKHPAHGAVPEWGEGLPGYGRRYGSEFGTGFISVSSKYALGEVLHQDVTYHACDCPGRPVHRFLHLFIGSYAAHTEHGRTLPSIPILVSPFIASEAAVHIWYPSRFNVSDALRISLSPLYTLPIRNLIAEYGGK
jgi:hypothetical protein